MSRHYSFASDCDRVAEHLQAEAEQVMLLTPAAASMLSSPSSMVVAHAKNKELVKAAALTTRTGKPRC